MTKVLDIKRVIEEIRNSSNESAVYVGCDSQRFKEGNSWYIVYVTAVVIHKDQAHGANILYGSEIVKDYSGSLHERLFNEAMKAVAVAMELQPIVEGRTFQVHLDINKNPDHKSNSVMSSAIGYVKGCLGLDPVLKSDDPMADYPIAASAAADRFATKKAVYHRDTAGSRS